MPPTAAVGDGGRGGGRAARGAWTPAAISRGDGPAISIDPGWTMPVMPVTGRLVALGRHVGQLEFLEIPLVSEPARLPEVEVYRRLLLDETDASAELIEEWVEAGSAAEAFDEVLVRALAFADQIRLRGAVASASVRGRRSSWCWGTEHSRRTAGVRLAGAGRGPDRRLAGGGG